MNKPRSVLKDHYVGYMIIPPVLSIKARHRHSKTYTLESRIIGGVGIIGGLDIVIIINNRGGWTG